MRKKKAAKVKLEPVVAKKVADRDQTKLDLKGYRLTDVHMALIDMSQFQSLVWLNLPSNQLTELPIGICSLPTLKTLRLSSNYLSSLPTHISGLSNLTSLDLAKNDFKTLGPEIGSLTNLLDLNLHWNGLTNICSELNNLVKLKTFNMSLNCLSSITPFGSCVKMENLDLSHNRLQDIPDFFHSFSSLASLNLAGNRLSRNTVGAVLSSLTSLTTLDVQGNEIQELPNGISELINLRYFRLRGNYITTLPDGISKLVNLEELEISNNFLATVPKGITCLTKLSALLLYQNKIKSLPDGIHNLVQIRELGLAYNSLTQLPNAIFNLPKISNFSAQFNHLKSLPDDAFTNLSECQELYLNHNCLESLPSTTSLLVSLHKLEALSNKLYSLPSLNLLSALQILELGDNNFSKFPKQILSCPTLTHLNLFSNHISSIPEGLSELKNLKRLFLGYNQLSSLPQGISCLSQLEELSLSGNKFTEFPVEVIPLAPSLKSLAMGNNFLTEIPSQVSYLSLLETLHVNNNKLIKVSGDLAKLENLSELDLSHNELTDLPSDFGNLRKLLDLDVSGNLLHLMPDSFENNCSQIKQLKIGFNNLWRVPHFPALEKIKEVESTINVHLPFISCASNPLIASWYGAKVDEKQLQKEFMKQEKRLSKRWKKSSENSDSVSSQEEVTVGVSVRPYNTAPGLDSATSPTHNNDIDDENKNNSTPSTSPTNTTTPSPPSNFLSPSASGEVSSTSTTNTTTVPSSFPYLRNIKSPKKKSRGSSVGAEGGESGSHQLYPNLHVNSNPFLNSESDLLYYRCRVGWSELRGRRPTQEDTITICTNFRGNLDRTLIASFDGHAGEKSSELAARRVASILAQHLDFVEQLEEGILGSFNQHELLFPMCPSTSTQDSQKRGVTNFEFDKSSKKELLSTLAALRESLKDTTSTTTTSPSSLSPQVTSSNSAVQDDIREEDEKSPSTPSSPVIGTKAETPRRTFGGSRLPTHKKSKHAHDDKVDEREKCGDAPSATTTRDPNISLTSPISPRTSVSESDEKITTTTTPNILPLTSPSSSRNNVPSITTTNTSTNTTITIASPTSEPRTKGANKASSGKSPKLAVKKSAMKQRNYLSEAEHSWVFNATLESLHRKITKRKFTDGAAALLILVEHDHKRLVIANSGDERAVLARGEFAVPLTTDHKPDEAQEKLRIYHVGGFINESRRVDGILTLSRSVGDNYLQPHVTYCPDVCFVDLIPEDKFLIVGCDGLWDVVTNEEAVAIANKAQNPAQAAAMLRDYAYFLGSQDNISVIVYQLDGSVTPEHLQLHSKRTQSKQKKRITGMQLSKSSPVPLIELPEEKAAQPLTSTSGGAVLPDSGTESSGEPVKKTRADHPHSEPRPREGLSSHRKRDVDKKSRK